MKLIYVTLCFLFLGLVFADEPPKPVAAKPETTIVSAPLTKAQIYALNAVGEKLNAAQKQNADLVKIQNDLVIEACKGIGVPEAQVSACRIDPESLKVIWDKPAKETKPTESKK